MNIRMVVWTLCMAVAGFLLAGSKPSLTSVTILCLIAGAAAGVALGIIFNHRARRRSTLSGNAGDESKPMQNKFAA
jgi:hypothetical protein